MPANSVQIDDTGAVEKNTLASSRINPFLSEEENGEPWKNPDDIVENKLFLSLHFINIFVVQALFSIFLEKEIERCSSIF